MSFALVSITAADGKTIYQAVGPDPYEPSALWLGDGTNQSLYAIQRSGSDTVQFIRQRVISAHSAATTENVVVATVRLADGVLQSVVSDNIGTTFTSGTLLDGQRVITGYLTGPLNGPIDVWQTLSLDSKGRATSISQAVDNKVLTTSLTYDSATVAVSRGTPPEVTRYKYQRDGGDVVLSGIEAPRSAVAFAYAPSLDNELISIQDRRFSAPTFRLEEIVPGKSLRWRDLDAQYETSYTVDTAKAVYTIRRMPSVKAEQPATLEVVQVDTSRTTTFVQGKVQVVTKMTVADTGITTSRIVTVDGKTVSDIEGQQIYSTLQGGVERLQSTLSDRVNGSRISEESSSSTSQFAVKSLSTSENGLSAGLEFGTTSSGNESLNTLKLSWLGREVQTVTDQATKEGSRREDYREVPGAFHYLREVMEISHNPNALTHHYSWEGR
jgi:hypothetical protein